MLMDLTNLESRHIFVGSKDKTMVYKITLFTKVTGVITLNIFSSSPLIAINEARVRYPTCAILKVE